MICTTIKEGYDCAFMSKKGCQYNGGACKPVIDKCEGCQKAVTFPAGVYCVAFPDPAAKWRFGNCNMATHIKIEAKKGAGKTNPIKASKRASR
jgi:hypothetical protein